MPTWKTYLNNLFSGITFKTTLLGSAFAGTLSLPTWQMPALHNLVQRMPPVVPANAKPEGAVFTINWLSACRDRRVRGGLVVRTRPAVECRTVGRGRAPNRSSLGDPDPGHRAGAGTRVPHPLLWHRRGARSGVHQRGVPVSLLRGLPGLAGGVPHRLRHRLQRAVRQPAADHRPAAPLERDAHRRRPTRRGASWER